MEGPDLARPVAGDALALARRAGTCSGTDLKDGEGVMGLERAFRVAGARSMVMTVWPVDDRVTRDFMRGLYSERFGQRATTADATWLAARKLLQQ
jgi:CHAT domain-containing protein